MHGPLMVDLADLVPDEAARWGMVSRCDINQRWSPAIAQVNGRLSGYLCEVMAARDAALGTATGKPVADDLRWWRNEAGWFADQIETHCLHCSAPLRMAPRPDTDRTDDVSESTLSMAANAGRRNVCHFEVSRQAKELTDYQGLRGGNQ